MSKAGLIHSVHLSIGRKDVAERDPDIAQATELADQAFMKSTEAAMRTLDGEMLMSVVRHWKRLPTTQNILDYLGPQFSVVLEKPYRKVVRQAKRQDQATIETVKAMIEAA